MSKSETKPQYAQNAFWLSIIGFVLGGMGVIGGIANGLTTGDSIHYQFAGLFATCSAIQLSAVWLIRNKKIVPGVFIVLTIFIISFASTIFQFESLGPAIGIVIILGFWQISHLCLPKSYRLYGTAYGFIAGLIIIFLDLSVLGRRISLDIAANTGYFIVAVLSIGLLVLVIRGFRYYSLRMKFVTAVTILSIVSIGVTTISVTRALNAILTEELGSDLENLAESKSSALGEILASEIRSLETLRQNSVLINSVQNTNLTYIANSREQIDARLAQSDLEWRGTLDAGDLSPLSIRYLFNDAAIELRNFKNSFPENTELVLTDQHGGLVAATILPNDFYQADERWWQETHNNGEGKTYVGRPTNGESTGVYGIVIALPIYDALNQVGGVLYVNYSLEDLMDRVGTTINDERSTTRLIVAIENEQVLQFTGSNYALGPISLAGQDGLSYNSGYFIDQFQGKSQFISIAQIRTDSNVNTINDLDWGIIAYREQAEALSVIQAQQNIQIAIGVAIVLAGSLAAALVGRIVSDPILKLANIAQRLAKGERRARIEVDSGDEIASLGLAFNEMADQIELNIQELERRVNERTQALEASFRITQALSTYIYQDDLIRAVVEQLSDAFDYYHVHVYLHNEKAGLLEHKAGTGDIGQQLLTKKHTLTVDQGIVGRAFSSNMHILVSDVSRDPDWTPNELLPDTKSELAVPIETGGLIWGVIDIQEATVDGLTQQDVRLITAVASQTGVALRNATFYEEARQRAERESLINLIREKIQTTQDVDAALKNGRARTWSSMNSKQTAVRVHTPKQITKSTFASD